MQSRVLDKAEAQLVKQIVGDNRRFSELVDMFERHVLIFDDIINTTPRQTLSEYIEASGSLKAKVHLKQYQKAQMMAPTFTGASLVPELIIYSMLDDLDKVKRLIKSGADPFMVFQNLLPVHFAILMEAKTVTEYYLVMYMHDSSKLSRLQQDYLSFCSILIRSSEIFKLLVTHRKFNSNLKNRVEVPILLESAALGRNDVVRSLIEQKADLNVTDNHNRGLLQYTVSYGDLRHVKYVVEELGLRQNINDAMFLGGSYKRQDAVHYLSRLGVARTNAETQVILHGEHSQDTLEQVKSTLPTSKSDYVQYRYNSPFGQFYPSHKLSIEETWFHSARYGRVSQLRKLLPDLSTGVKDTLVRAALPIAAKSGTLDVVKFLVEEARCDLSEISALPGSVADLSTIPKKPLLLAIAFGHAHVVDYLLSHHHYDLNSEDEMACHLMWAVYFRQPIMLYAIIEKIKESAITKINYAQQSTVADKHGRTPLHYAVLGGSMDSVNKYIKKGYDVNARDGLGRTPLHYGVIMFGIMHPMADIFLGMVNTLISHDRIIIHPIDKLGYTPLAYALDRRAYSLISHMFEAILAKEQKIEEDIAQSVSLFVGEVIDSALTQFERTLNNRYQHSKITSIDQAQTVLFDLTIDPTKEFLFADKVDLMHLAESGFYRGKELAASEVIDIMKRIFAKLPKEKHHAITTQNGDTVLHLAVHGNHEEVVRYLVTLGHDLVQAKNKAGQTAYDLAVSNCFDHLKPLLKMIYPPLAPVPSARGLYAVKEDKNAGSTGYCRVDYPALDGIRQTGI